MDEHSEEPWRAEGHAIKSGGKHVGKVEESADIGHREALANARRIAACVNACKNIPTEDLLANRFEIARHHQPHKQTIPHQRRKQ